MKTEDKALRIGTWFLVFALAVRFIGGSLLSDIHALRENPGLSSLLLYLGTGRVFTPDETTEPPEATHSTAPPTEPPPRAFSPEDASLVAIQNHPGYPVDVQAMLQQPLQWLLTDAQPTVLIIHSHTCESYENTEGYLPTVDYRTLDEDYNMISVGAHLAKALKERGISVIHDTTVHDYPSYDNAYKLSRKTVAQYLQQYPSICLVLDIHRDAYENAAGQQVSNTITIDGQSSAKLMIVAGTDAYGENHPQWRNNTAIAVKLQAVLEQRYPGLCRPLSIRSSAFNQDLSPGALLIEVGTAGDTRQEALTAAGFLAEGIAALAGGSGSLA